MKEGTRLVLLSTDTYDLFIDLEKGQEFFYEEDIFQNSLISVKNTNHDSIGYTLFKKQVVRLDKPIRAIKAMLKHGIAFNIMTNGHNAEITNLLESLGSIELSGSSLTNSSNIIHISVNGIYMKGFREDLNGKPTVNYATKHKSQPAIDATTLEDIPPAPYHMKGGDWWLTEAGSVRNATSDIGTKTNGTEFATKEAAEKAAIAYRKFHALYKLAEDLNEGWEPDWNSPTLKWGIGTNSQRLYSFPIEHRSPSSIYFKSEKVANKAIEIINANSGMFF